MQPPDDSGVKAKAEKSLIYVNIIPWHFSNISNFIYVPSVYCCGVRSLPNATCDGIGEANKLASAVHLGMWDIVHERKARDSAQASLPADQSWKKCNTG